MSSSADIHSVQALEGMRDSLQRVGSDTPQLLYAAEQEIRQTEEWLKKRLAYWQAEVERRQAAVRMAAGALARCQASGYTDEDGNYYPPSCGTEEQALAEYQQLLREAQRNLEEVQRWIARIGQAATRYRTQAQRTRQMLDSGLPQGVAYLGQKITELHVYLAGAAPVVTGGGGNVPSISPPASPPGNSSSPDPWVTGGLVGLAAVSGLVSSPSASGPPANLTSPGGGLPGSPPGSPVPQPIGAATPATSPPLAIPGGSPLALPAAVAAPYRYLKDPPSVAIGKDFTPKQHEVLCMRSEEHT